MVYCKIHNVIGLDDETCWLCDAGVKPEEPIDYFKDDKKEVIVKQTTFADIKPDCEECENLECVDDKGVCEYCHHVNS